MLIGPQSDVKRALNVRNLPPHIDDLPAVVGGFDGQSPSPGKIDDRLIILLGGAEFFAKLRWAEVTTILRAGGIIESP